MINFRNVKKDDGKVFLKYFSITNPQKKGGSRIDPEKDSHKAVFYAVITDLKESGYIRVRDAKKIDDTTWEILSENDKNYYRLAVEPDVTRKMYGAKLYHIDRTGCFPKKEYAKFEEVQERIKKGERWHLEMDDPNRVLRTGAIIKLWRDRHRKHHAITESGSHYIF